MDQSDLGFFQLCFACWWFADSRTGVSSVFLNQNYNIKIKYLELSSIFHDSSTLQSPGVVYLQFLLCSGVVAAWQLTSNEGSFLD